MLKRKATVKETITQKTADGREYTRVREASILERSAEDLSDFPTEQADRQIRYKVYYFARKYIWPALCKICTPVALAWFSDTPFVQDTPLGQFIFDLFIGMI